MCNYHKIGLWTFINMIVTLNYSLIPNPVVLSMHECISYLCRFDSLGYLIVIELSGVVCAWIPSLRWLRSSFIIFLHIGASLFYCNWTIWMFMWTWTLISLVLESWNRNMSSDSSKELSSGFQKLLHHWNFYQQCIWVLTFNNLQLLFSTEFSMCDMVSHSHSDFHNADHLFMSMNKLGICIFSMVNVYSYSLLMFFFNWFTSYFHYSTVRVLHML